MPANLNKPRVYSDHDDKTMFEPVFEMDDVITEPVTVALEVTARRPTVEIQTAAEATNITAGRAAGAARLGQEIFGIMIEALVRPVNAPSITPPIRPPAPPPFPPLPSTELSAPELFDETTELRNRVQNLEESLGALRPFSVHSTHESPGPISAAPTSPVYVAHGFDLNPTPDSEAAESGSEGQDLNTDPEIATEI